MNETPTTKKRRVQFEKPESDDSVECLGSEPTNRKPTPSTAARTVVVKAVESHPEPIRDLLKSMSQSFNALRSKLRQQDQTLVKLTEDSFVPRSARITFKMVASESVQEKQEYKTLAATMEAASDAWKTTAKETIHAIAKLEIENTKAEIALNFISTAKQVAKLLLLNADPNTTLSEVTLAALALETHGATLTKHSALSLAEAQQILHHPGTYTSAGVLENTKTLLNPFIPDFATLMTAAYVDSWDAQLDCYKKQASDRAMTKQVREFLDGTATQQAAAAMDVEPTADPALLREIVKKQVDCSHQKMQQQLNQLQQLVARSMKPTDATPKNKNRGAPAKTPPRAPSTKKTQAATALKSALKKPGPKTPPRKPAATVDKRDDATPSGKAKIKLFRKASPERGRNLKKTASKKQQSRK